MKALVLLIAALVAYSATAANYEPVNASLAHLSRHFQITLEGDTFELAFIEHGYKSAYYATLEQGEVLAHVWDKGQQQKDLELQLYRDGQFYRFSMAKGFRRGTLTGTKFTKKHGREMTTSNNMHYWYNFDCNDDPVGTPVTITVDSALTSRQSIAQHVSVTGPMSFSPCDGCEHGDQLFVENVNVVNLDFGRWYELDCEGRLEPLFYSLLDEGLAVPFTFKGRVNFDSGDLVEDFESHWVADHTGGELFIGTTQKLPFKLFMESLIHRSAFLLGVEVSPMYRDLLRKGKFTSYENGVLTFVYKSVSIRTNLLTGRTL